MIEISILLVVIAIILCLISLVFPKHANKSIYKSIKANYVIFRYLTMSQSIMTIAFLLCLLGFVILLFTCKG